ncbi:hypothetical protein PMIN01_06284 [Paraphaeosphaeria minitans]|uniref:Uncharacterized protein n=1 Tax=Paraphaeosphaeria minitans TaxID=565426 RepID=A0A9P6GJ60_9PLEO|nr:hypothetical protein PMIN01_06284 [Paraphaeosphaeria minitans]
MKMQCKRRSQIANRRTGGWYMLGDGYKTHPSNLYPHREAAVAFLCHREWPYSAEEHGESPVKMPKKRTVCLWIGKPCAASYTPYILVLWPHPSPTQEHFWITLPSSYQPLQRHDMRFPCYVTESASRRQTVSLCSSTVPSCSSRFSTYSSCMTRLPNVRIQRQAVLIQVLSTTCRNCS